MIIDRRAFLKPKSDAIPALEELFGESNDPMTNILAPLKKTRGLLLPYAPEVRLAWSATYDETFHFTHTNYAYPAYEKSKPEDIIINCSFTSQTDNEARYTLAAMHFMKTATKNYFGESDLTKAGTPPPVMRFSYLGAFVLKDIPVVIKSAEFTLTNSVDYVPVFFDNDKDTTYVPTKLDMVISLTPLYNPQTVRKEFDLNKFRTGELLKTKGFI